MTLTAYIGTAEGNAWLQEHLTSRTCWLGLHETEPTAAGDPSTEVTGGGYVRQRIIFGSPSSKTVTSINNQIFSGMPATTIRWVAVWSAQFGGRVIAVIQLLSGGSPSSQSVPAGGQFLGAAGDVAVSL